MCATTNKDRVVHPSTTFKHTPLVDAEHNIRLLELLPRTNSDGLIRLSLQKHVPLIHSKDQRKKSVPSSERKRRHSRTSYTAISYEWGDAKGRRQTIKIEGNSFEIRQNLYNLLFRLAGREDLRRRSFWIDAICIDQDNVCEKNSQVQQMKDIFRNADEVFVWLGEAADGSDLAADCINSMRDETDLGHYTGPTRQSIRLYLSPDSTGSDDMGGEGPVKPLKALCRRSYFTRMWVVQELLLASTIRVLCGNKEWMWNDWWSLLTRSHGALSGKEYCEYATDDSNARKLNVWRETYARNKRTGLTLHQLIESYCNFQCTDPRDRVFGLLGITSEGTSLTVDYNQSLEHLFLACLVRCRHILSIRGTIANLRAALGLTEVVLHEKSSLADMLNLVYSNHSLCPISLPSTESGIGSAQRSRREANELLTATRYTWRSWDRKSSNPRRALESLEKSWNKGASVSCLCCRCTSMNEIICRPESFQYPSEQLRRLPGVLHPTGAADVQPMFDTTIVLDGDVYVETLISHERRWLRNKIGEPTCWLSLYDRLTAASIRPSGDGNLEITMSTAMVLNLVAHSAFLGRIAGDLDPSLTHGRS